MASAQVLSNPAASSRKQEHLEAGKRRLEEFRKKKAAAKKASSTSQPRTADSTANEKQASENGHTQFVNSVYTSADGRTDEVNETSGFLPRDEKLLGFTHDRKSELAPLAYLNPQSHKPEEKSDDIAGLKYQMSSIYSQQADDKVGNFGVDTGGGIYADGISSARPNVPRDDDRSYSYSTLYGVKESHSNKDISSYESMSGTNISANDVAAKVYPEGHVTNVVQHESDSMHPKFNLPAFASEIGHSQHGALNIKNNLISGFEERKPSNAVGNLSSFYNQQAPQPLSADFNSSVGSSLNGPLYSAANETYPRRSRPSFLDSLNIVRDSSSSGHSHSEKEDFTTSMFPSSNFASSSAPVEPLPTPVTPYPGADFFGNASKGQSLFENKLESKLEFISQTQNEDFAALEQHIEDLTQEKFSLQRALEASKTLAESLAAENSSLTESYNQQASIVNQLKAEMEILQGEIKARLVELESIKAVYTNTQLECTAADERAKLLASEVIGLEEKALRLRSNELKLERELENASAEIASYKKKLSSLDKERRDLLQTIDALQEEKKVLQSKFRRASASGISVDTSKGLLKKDVSTSTNDLGLDGTGVDESSSEQASSSVQPHDDADNLSLFSQSRALGFEHSLMNIPPDQVQMIQNINSLISEITTEKEELMQALLTEVSTSTKLKDLNKELSQKLEVQTQRLELLTAQSMASGTISASQPPGSRIVRESVAYADEGDEVVERVLGWIMKLFPGGPSKRRTSRL